MNKRIQELAEQAWDDTREKFGSFVDDGGEIDYTFLHAYDQKFAELIVKECADKAYKTAWDDLVHGHGQAVIPLHLYNTIKEHFGVEE